MTVESLDELRRHDLIVTLDRIRAAVESGEIVALSAVGIEREDATRYYHAASGPVTVLRFAGAIAALEFDFHTRFGR